MSNKLKAKNFHIVQYVRHPVTGELLITAEQIADGLAHKTIKRYALIYHDKDPYTEEDIRKEQKKAKEENRPPNPNIAVGNIKPPHYHIVLTTVDPVTGNGNTLEVEKVAQWFGVPPQYVDTMHGHGSFLDGVEYLTHCSPKEQQKGKYRYDDSEVEASFGFDWRAELDKRIADRAAHGVAYANLDKFNKMYYALYTGEKTLSECEDEDIILFMKYRDRFEEAARYYIVDRPPPNTRLSFYIEGDGGGGKGALSKALAHALFPDIKTDKELFFETGATGVGFQKYNGQPVIIWNDRRASGILSELQDSGNVFNVFDPHPTSQQQNIKYGAVSLINKVHIVNSVEPYSSFLDRLAGAEDRKQSYRRFPFILKIEDKCVRFLVNKGVAEGTNEYLKYDSYTLQGDVKKLSDICGGDRNLANELLGYLLADVAKRYNEVLNSIDNPKHTREEIINMAKAMGVAIPTDGSAA